MTLTRASLLQTLLVAAAAAPLVAGCGGKTSDTTDSTTGPGGGGGTSGSSGQGGSGATGGTSSTGGTTSTTGGTGGSPIAGAGGASVGGSGGASGAGAATTGGAGGIVTAGASGTSSGSGGTSSGSGGGVSTGGAAGGGGGTSKIACDDPKPVLVGGQETGFVRCANGAFVRAESRTCPNLLSASQTCGNPGDPGVCHTNADCKGGVGPYAYCGQGGGFGPSCECLTGCVQDSDCASDELCQCGDPVGRCVKSTCRTGDDCAEGGCAQVEVGLPGCGTQEFACQTKADTCASNDDCAKSAGLCHIENPGDPRQCEPYTCAAGRPLLVEQGMRLAALTAAPAWG